MGRGHLCIFDAEVVVMYCLHDVLPLRCKLLMAGSGVHSGIKDGNCGGGDVDVHYHMLMWVGDAVYEELIGVVSGEFEACEVEGEVFGLFR